MADGIAYQSKDIVSKVFAESFGVKSLNVYGLNLPKIVRLLPTNLPAIEADEWRLDAIFELEDGSIALIDYESDYHGSDKIKYAGYLLRVVKRYVQRKEAVPKTIRMIVIYTADVARKQVQTEIDHGSFRLTIEPAFLSELDGDELRAALTAKIDAGERLTDEDVMRFIVLPLTYRSREKKQEMLRETVRLATKVEDAETSNFILAGLVVFGDKYIDARTRESAKEWIRMTQVGRAFLEEKEEAVQEERVKTAEANARADEANARAEKANARAEEANARAEEADTRAEEANAKAAKIAKELDAANAKANGAQAAQAAQAALIVRMVETLARSEGISIEASSEKLELTLDDYIKARITAETPVAAAAS